MHRFRRAVDVFARCRWPRGTRRIVVLAILPLVAAAGSGPRAPEISRPLSAPDSARNLRVGKLALRNYWRRLVPPPPGTRFAMYDIYSHKRSGSFLPLALCEREIGPFCYGPRNGRLVYNGPTALPVAQRTADRAVMSVLRRLVSRLHRDFLRELDRLQGNAPGDRWIMGQRVFHRVERGEIQDAARAADGCRSDPWWCAALIGYTKTLLGLDRTADSAFARALTTMPDSVRCEWEDLTPLFDGDPTADWYRDLDCAGRRAVNPTVWWLADPLFLEPGNDRERDHYFRMVLLQLSRDSEERIEPGIRKWGELRNSVPDGPSYHAALVRLGEPHYVAVGESPTEWLPPTLVLQYAQPVYHFASSGGAVRDPLRARPADWAPLDSFPAEHHRPRFGRFTALDHQVAFFRRGDSARIVAASTVGSDTMLMRAPLLGSALVLARSAHDSLRVIREPIAGTHTFLATVAPESVLVSLEAIGAGVGAGRARFASGLSPMPAQRVTLSDVLVLDSGTALPSDLETAAARAAPSTRVPEGGAVGLYWEVYGLVATDTMSISLSVTERSRSALGRLGQRLGIVAGTDSTQVRWTEIRVGAGGIVGQSVALDLRTLRRSTYTLRLEIAVPAQLPVAVTREIAIVER